VKGRLVSATPEQVVVAVDGGQLTIQLDNVSSIDFRPKIADQEAQLILDALVKMRTVAEVGVNYRDYGQALIEVKLVVERNLPKISDQDLKKDFDRALNNYALVKDVWALTIAGKGSTRDEDFNKLVRISWDIASKSIAHAQDLMNGKRTKF